MNDLSKQGYTLKVTESLAKHEDSLFYVVTAFLGENKVGEYLFKKTLPSDEPRMLPENCLVSVESDTKEEYRRKGLATWAYCFIEEYTGLKLTFDPRVMALTKDGKAFWNQPNRPFGS